MWKLSALIFPISVALLPGCSTLSPYQENSSATYVHSTLSTVMSLERQDVQDALETIPAQKSRNQLTVITLPGTSVQFSVGRDEFFGNTPCRSYFVSVDGESQGGYACRDENGRWSNANRQAIIEGHGQPVVLSFAPPAAPQMRRQNLADQAPPVSRQGTPKASMSTPQKAAVSQQKEQKKKKEYRFHDWYEN
ncbi:MAG TPA: hypothetical protein VFM02_04485 [Candidatus Paceibacterota bacterium]|nr:hypothetical protein [Candidatus Paceibacterota bacterium]